MNNTYIEFKKQRDFSSILSDTFAFIRNEFKPLMKTIFNIAGPFILIYLLSLAVYNYVSGDVFDFTSYESQINSSSLMITFVTFFLYAISGIAAYIFLVGSVLYYIKSYVDNKGNVNFDDIKTNTYKSFWAFFGLGLLKIITLIMATLLCFLPVLYAIVPMAVVFSLYVFESRNSVIDAYSKSFNIVNADFWTAFGSFIVLFIIYYVAAIVFALPATIYTMINTGIFSGEVDPANLEDFVKNPILIILSILQAFFQILIYTTLIIGGVIIYFHLNEKINHTGTYERINQIGNTSD